MRRAITLLALSGCGLYFSPEPHPGEDDEPSDAGADAPIDAKPCPAVGAFGEITSPVDGAMNVPNPTQIRWRIVTTNTIDGRGTGLRDANGNGVSLDHWNPSCAGTDGEYRIECYDLEPDSVYTYELWITCYDASGIRSVATTTFRTAK